MNERDIFEEPDFGIGELCAADVRQGPYGNCWFIASISTLSQREDLLRKLCVAKNEEVDVYGFVFYRGI